MTTITMTMLDKTTAIETNSHPAETKNELYQLVENLQAQKPDALEAIIKKTEKACFHLAFSILKDPDLSKDALQDAYFVVYRRIGQLHEPKAFKSWLFTIVSRACQDIRRKRSGDIETDLSQHEELLVDDTGSPSNSTEQVLDRSLVRSTFQILPEIDREALALREICSLSYEEMSTVLKIPVGTVRSRLAKARQRFIKAYRKDPKA